MRRAEDTGESAADEERRKIGPALLETKRGEPLFASNPPPDQYSERVSAAKSSPLTSCRPANLALSQNAVVVAVDPVEVPPVAAPLKTLDHSVPVAVPGPRSAEPPAIFVPPPIFESPVTVGALPFHLVAKRPFPLRLLPPEVASTLPLQLLPPRMIFASQPVSSPILAAIFSYFPLPAPLPSIVVVSRHRHGNRQCKRQNNQAQNPSRSHLRSLPPI
jgi:hypothetical protein